MVQRQESATTAAEAFPERKALPFYVSIPVRLWREKPLSAAGGVLVMVMLLVAIFADLIAPYGYNETFTRDALQPYSRKYWLGTDDIGRDIFSRVVYGARISIYVGFSSVALGILVATFIGAISGYYGGWVDNLLQRVVDVLMSIPPIVLLILIVAFTGPGLMVMILALALTLILRGIRVFRGTVMSLRENVYVEAARGIGCKDSRILIMHILPNMVAPIIILATVNLGYVILAEAAISFLGFGIPPPMPSWGQMLSGEGRAYMLQAPWIAIWPGVALSSAVFGFNMLGDGLRDLLDPRLRGSAHLR